MKRLFQFIAFLLLIQISYGNKNPVIPEIRFQFKEFKKSNKKDTVIVLDYFNTVPDTIQLWGCRGEFRFDLRNRQKDKNILFISDERFAMISVNNKIVYLNQISDIQLTNKKSEIRFKGQGIELTLILKQKREEYLVRTYQGKLNLIQFNKQYSFKIIGKFAC